MKKIFSVLLIGVIAFGLTGCGGSKADDESALKTIKAAVKKVYEKNEKLNTNNVQKYMEGNWIIVEAPADNTRSSIPLELDKLTADEEWKVMFITACNTKTEICKDLKIMRSSDDNKLFVASEAGAYPQTKKWKQQKD